MLTYDIDDVVVEIQISRIAAGMNLNSVSSVNMAKTLIAGLTQQHSLVLKSGV